jgi:hypothetical protein
MNAMQPRRLTGRGWNGAERDGGAVWHAVAEASSPFGKALCGAQPGLRSNGWTEPGERVTCPRCLKRQK